MSQGYPGAGLVAGIAAVIVNQGAGYAMVPWICASRINPVPLLAVLCAAVALLGALISWRALDSGRQSIPDSHAGGHPHDFLAGVSIFFATLCAAVVLTQGAAGLVFDGCER